VNQIIREEKGGIGSVRKIVVGTLLALLLLAGTATAVRDVERVEIRAGDIVAIGYGGFRPDTLPKHHDAPIVLYGGGELSTVSGELPPVLDEINFEFDRHGHLDTAGLPVCTRAKLVATDTAAARRNCKGAIVGTGFGHVVVKFPEQGPIPASSPITIFNGPKKDGNDTVLAHAYLDVPSPTTFIVPVVIEKIHKGVYGYRVEAKIPRIAGGYGHPISGSLTVGRKWTYKGTRYSYINARCETGRLQARGEFTFGDGTRLSGTFFRPCKVRE
jgi:hypothetical protein